MLPTYYCTVIKHMPGIFGITFVFLCDSSNTDL